MGFSGQTTAVFNSQDQIRIDQITDSIRNDHTADNKVKGLTDHNNRRKSLDKNPNKFSPFMSGISQQKTTDCFAELFNGLKSKNGFLPLLFNFLLVLRRIVLVVIAIQINKQAWLQVILFIIISEYICAYLWSVQPFESKSQNSLEITNELFILIIGYSAAVSVGWNLPFTHRFTVGLATIILIFTMIVFNIVRWAIFVANYIRISCRRFIKRRRSSKKVAVKRAHDRKVQK